jgi:hypothetical protein
MDIEALGQQDAPQSAIKATPARTLRQRILTRTPVATRRQASVSNNADAFQMPPINVAFGNAPHHGHCKAEAPQGNHIQSQSADHT